jgi:hypothetical protein
MMMDALAGTSGVFSNETWDIYTKHIISKEDPPNAFDRFVFSYS